MKRIKELYYKVYYYLQTYGLITAYIIGGLLLCLTLNSCKTVEIEKEVIKVDTVYSHSTDTLKIVDIKRDTIRTVDSVYQFIWQKNDTVIIKERVVNNNYSSTNNNYEKEQSKVDTVYQVKIDTQIVEKEKKPTAWDKLKLRFQGSLFAVFIIALLLFGLWIWKRFK